MIAIIALALLPILPPRQPADSGAILYHAWCSSCHGADGHGTSKAMTKLEVPAADLASCASSTAETMDNWIRVVKNGGAAYGLSMDMPAFGENATDEQIEDVVKFARSLCHESGWPPGELNFPRAYLSEKAFPENEVVLVNYDRQQSWIYERRIGRRFQMEAVGRTNLDGRPFFQSATAALKYNAFFGARPLRIGTLGLEVTPPIGQQAELEVEPYIAFGLSPGTNWAIQGEALATIEDGFGGVTLNLGLGHQIGRFVPMVEGGWTIPQGGSQSFALYPQLWFQLSRLGHVAGSVGMELPVTSTPDRTPRLIAFLLWDFGDAPLNRGW
jgi:mono/diheme cytochrome c family protein